LTEGKGLSIKVKDADRKVILNSNRFKMGSRFNLQIGGTLPITITYTFIDHQAGFIVVAKRSASPRRALVQKGDDF